MGKFIKAFLFLLTLNSVPSYSVDVKTPTLVGGIVPVVNIAGIEPGQLKLSGEVLADIFLGKITQWNDPRIAADNKDLILPDQRIVVVYRADESETAFTFTSYLAQVSPDWKRNVGAGKSVRWPVGTGGKGNQAVASYVLRIKYSIGYVEYATAILRDKLAYVQLKNRDGQFVSPSGVSLKAVQTVEEMQSIRSLGFDGKSVMRPDDRESYACGVLSLHADSLASQLGIEEGDIITFYYGNLRSGCEEIDNQSKNLYFSKKPSIVQVVNSQGMRDLPITTEQFLLANGNLSKPLSTSPKNSIPWYSGDKRKGNVKMIPNTSPECEGIEITEAGFDLFNRAVGYIYVAMKNKSGKRKKITLDIEWRSQSETYLGKNDNTFDQEFGPEVLRPTDEGIVTKFDVTPGRIPGLTMQKVELVECR